MDKEQLQDLADRIIAGKATSEEINWYVGLFQNEEKIADPEVEKWNLRKETVYVRLHERLFRENQSSLRRWKRMGIAAAVLLATSFGLYTAIKSLQENVNQQQYAVDFAPAPNKAILTLANGKKIVLDDVKSAQVTAANGITVARNANGQLVYTATDADLTNLTDSNLVTTPRGAAHQVILSDGTHVWLNASSSLKFPTAFGNQMRQVNLTGEAYFEVAKNAAKPFVVNTDRGAIRVLGTHFNVNNYSDEQSLTTTLLEGSIAVSNNSGKALLKPGQQALASSGTGPTVKDCDNPDDVVAWKNGSFSFTDANAQEIMRQVSRWYDVDVEFKSKRNDYQLSAHFSRNMNSTKVLQILSYTGLKFKTEGRKIIVE